MIKIILDKKVNKITEIYPNNKILWLPIEDIHIDSNLDYEFYEANGEFGMCDGRMVKGSFLQELIKKLK